MNDDTRARPWAEVLIAEMARRLRLLVAAKRHPSSDIDEAFYAAVSTSGSTSGPTSISTVDPIADATADIELPRPVFSPGTLSRLLFDGAPESSSHLQSLQQRFGLSGFEMDVLLVALSVEMAPRFERVFAHLEDAATPRPPSADAVMQCTATGRWELQALMSRDARLRRSGLLVAADASRSASLRLAEGVANHALSRNALDSTLTRAWCDDDEAPLAAPLWDTRPEGADIEAAMRAHHGGAVPDAPLLISLRGRSGSGRRHVVEAAARRIGIACIALDVRKFKAADIALRTLTAALRDAVLLNACVLLHHADAWLDDAAQWAELRSNWQPLVRELGSIIVFTSEDEFSLAARFPAARVIEFELPPLRTSQREDAWRLGLAAWPMTDLQRTASASALAAKFRLTHGEIALCIQRLTNPESRPATGAELSDRLHRIAAAVATPRLAQLAQPMTITHSLDDLVLPADRMAALEDIVRRVRHRGRVLDQWGLDGVSNRGRGVVALLHGASGTGKTMAAEAIAGVLRMQLFRIDLAGVVSKYIGETEKNLRAVFEEADRADAVLFFDEADALFGKRSDVKDAHDRYANIEINYLLQRIESFEGIAILATNLRTHLDEAFLRRIHVTVEFPLPGEVERLGLWDRSFPANAPLAADIDWAFLSKRFELTGGAIRNAALGAAFLAADGSGVIGMGDIVNALQAELIKAGKRVPANEFGTHAHHLHRAAAAPRRIHQRIRASMS